MARLPFLSRDRAPDTDAAEAPPPAPIPARRPQPGILRRERRMLLKLREQRLRDAGGLALEMYRRGLFREDLLAEQCADLIGIDERLVEIEHLLASRRRPLARCTCGAAILPGARYCAACGRPLAAYPGARDSEETVIEPRVEIR